MISGRPRRARISLAMATIGRGSWSPYALMDAADRLRGTAPASMAPTLSSWLMRMICPVCPRGPGVRSTASWSPPPFSPNTIHPGLDNRASWPTRRLDNSELHQRPCLLHGHNQIHPPRQPLSTASHSRSIGQRLLVGAASVGQGNQTEAAGAAVDKSNDLHHGHPPTTSTSVPPTLHTRAVTCNFTMRSAQWREAQVDSREFLSVWRQAAACIEAILAPPDES